MGRLRREPALRLTYEQHEEETELIQVDTWVRERVAEGCVDDHEEHTAADGTERRLLSLEPVLDVSPDNLKHTDQQVASFQRGSGWALQSDSDRKTERKESNLDEGHSGFQSFPATPFFFWGI